MSWKNKANQHHVHKKVIYKPEAQAKKLLNRIHKPEAQANRMVIMLVIHKNLNRIHKPEAQPKGMVIMLVTHKNLRLRFRLI